MSFDRLGHSIECPWGDGKPKWKELKYIDLAIHYERQKPMEGPTHGDVVEGVFEIYGDAPHGLHDACGYCGNPFHLEFWNHKECVQDGQVYDETVRTILLRNYEEA